MLGFISLIWETPFLVFYKLLSVQANSRNHNFKWYQYLLSIEIHIYMQDNLKHLMNIKHLSWQFPQAQNNHCLFIKIKYLYLIIMVHDMHEVRLSLPVIVLVHSRLCHSKQEIYQHHLTSSHYTCFYLLDL